MTVSPSSDATPAPAETVTCTIDGIQITDLARFFERVHGQVPIESLKVSWLIYGNGYRQNWRRTFMKRIFDILVAAFLLILTLPIMAMAAKCTVVQVREAVELGALDPETVVTPGIFVQRVVKVAPLLRKAA